MVEIRFNMLGKTSDFQCLQAHEPSFFLVAVRLSSFDLCLLLGIDSTSLCYHG